jgi:hypothetical protein
VANGPDEDSSSRWYVREFKLVTWTKSNDTPLRPCHELTLYKLLAMEAPLWRTLSIGANSISLLQGPIQEHGI